MLLAAVRLGLDSIIGTPRGRYYRRVHSGRPPKGSHSAACGRIRVAHERQGHREGWPCRPAEESLPVVLVAAFAGTGVLVATTVRLGLSPVLGRTRLRAARLRL